MTAPWMVAPISAFFGGASAAELRVSGIPSRMGTTVRLTDMSVGASVVNYKNLRRPFLACSVCLYDSLTAAGGPNRYLRRCKALCRGLLAAVFLHDEPDLRRQRKTFNDPVKVGA